MNCQHCRRELADEPVYRATKPSTENIWHDGSYGIIGSICADCAHSIRPNTDPRYPPLPVFVYQQWRTPQECEHCGRQVILNGRYPRPLYVVCSEACRRAVYDKAAAQRRRERKVSPDPQQCAVCGEPFVPARSDAAHCSPACRQKAYRDRQREERAGGW
jgi:hypothetical protein